MTTIERAWSNRGAPYGRSTTHVREAEREKELVADRASLQDGSSGEAGGRNGGVTGSLRRGQVRGSR